MLDYLQNNKYFTFFFLTQKHLSKFYETCEKYEGIYRNIHKTHSLLKKKTRFYVINVNKFDVSRLQKIILRSFIYYFTEQLIIKNSNENSKRYQWLKTLFFSRFFKRRLAIKGYLRNAICARKLNMQ